MVGQICVKEPNSNSQSLENSFIDRVLVIDSEVLRSPKSNKYYHAEDYQIKQDSSDFLKAISLLKATLKEKAKIYFLVDYPRLEKSSLFTLNQAKYNSGFFLELLPNFTGCFLIQDKREIILYSREIERIPQLKSDFCVKEQKESTLNSFESSDRHSIIFNYLRELNSEIIYVSDRSSDESLATNNCVSFYRSSQWLENFDASKYG